MEKQQYKWLRLCMLSLIPYFLLVGVFWGVLGYNIPPFDGAFPVEDLARHFREHAVRLRIAYAVAVPAWSLMVPWVVGIFVIMRRIEGRAGVLSYIQLVGGSLTVLVPTLSSVFLLTAAYRPETDAAIIRMLFDLAWLMIDLVFFVTTLQYAAAAIVFLNDPRSVPLVPKWLCWLGIWLGVEFIAEIIMPNFRSGPFSWSGLFNYWIPFMGPLTWMAIFSVYLYKAVGRLELEDESLRPAVPLH